MAAVQAEAQLTPAPHAPRITLLTDFGLADAYVGVMKGVIAGIAPRATVIDLCHAVPPQDVRAGAFLLLTSYRYFPAGTIHLVVVDPGVGTARKLVAARAGDYTFVGPDNGVLRWAVAAAAGEGLDQGQGAKGKRQGEEGGASQRGSGREGPDVVGVVGVVVAARTVRAVSIEHPRYRLPNPSHTFHGRDILAPAAAHLATGLNLAALGPPLATLAGEPFPAPVRTAAQLTGEVLYVDRFGNCITTIPAGALADPGFISAATGQPPCVTVARRRLTVVQAYGDVEPGQALALAGSSGFLEVAVRDGNAARQLGIGAGTPVVLEREA